MIESLGQYAFWGYCSVVMTVIATLVWRRKTDQYTLEEEYLQLCQKIAAIGDRETFERFRTGKVFWDYIRAAARYKKTREKANEIGKLMYEKHCELRDIEKGIL